MEPERWRRIKDLFAQALDLEGENRREWLENLSQSDPQIANEVARLLNLDKAATADFAVGPMVTGDANGQLPAEVGQTLGDFYLEACLGEGGMGCVYRARQTGSITRTVAIKIIRSGLPTEETLARFDRERRVAALMNHSQIAQLLEVGTTPSGRPYIVMEYVDGKPLDEAGDRYSLEVRLQLFLQVCQAVAFAHDLGVIHRDLNPSNILVTQDSPSCAKIIDFGIAKSVDLPAVQQTLETKVGGLMGTPCYMAPEQARGESVDFRTDIYGLGTVLYQLVFGEAPFDPRQPLSTILQQIQQEPPHHLRMRSRRTIDGIPRELYWILEKALAKEPGARYPSVSALEADVGRLLAGEAVSVGPPTWTYRMSKWMARRRKQWVPLSVAMVFLLLAFLWAGHTFLEAARIRKIANRDRELVRDVERVDRMVTAAKMAPLHQLAEERTRVSDLQRQWMLEMGSTEAPGGLLFALGRTHLLVGENELALDALRRAARLGFQDPLMNYYLGLAYAGHFWQEKQTLLALGTPKGQDRQMAALEREFLVPAVAYLDQAEADFVPEPAYLEGLQKFLAGDEEAALPGLEGLLERQPQFYPGHLLIGDVSLAMAQARRDQGDLDGADHAYHRALAAYREAIHIARSEPRGYRGISRVLVDRMVLDRSGQNEEVLDDARLALEELSKAKLVQPDDAETLLLEALVAMRTARYLARAGEDPSFYVCLAETAATELRDLEPFRYRGYRIQGAAHMFLAIYRYRRGLDCETSIQAAKSAFKQAIEVVPDSPLALQGLADVLVFASHVMRSRGENPSAAVEEALAALNRATRLAPEQPEYWDALGQVYFQHGRNLDQKGEDPFHAYRGAIRAASQALQVKEDAIFEYNCGLYHLGQTLSSLKRDCPWEAHAGQAIFHFQQAVALSHSYAKAYGQLGLTWMTKAAEKAKAGEPLGDDLGNAMAAINHAIALKPKDALGYINLARCHLLLAEQVPDSERGNALLEGDELLRVALELNPNHAFGNYVFAQLRAAQANLDESLRYLELALDLNPNQRLSATQDPRFQALRHHPGFQALVKDR